MSLKSTATRYGTMAISIHWLSALAIIGLLISGFVIANTTDLIAKAGMLKIHALMGVLVLLLTLFRVIWWAFLDKKPASLPNTPRMQALLANTVHVLFYVVILAMAGSGIGLMVLSGAGEIIFGGAARLLPDFHQYPPRAVHGIAAVAMVALIGLHLVGAIYHQWLKKEPLMARMGIGSTKE